MAITPSMPSNLPKSSYSASYRSTTSRNCSKPGNTVIWLPLLLLAKYKGSHQAESLDFQSLPQPPAEHIQACSRDRVDKVPRTLHTSPFGIRGKHDDGQEPDISFYAQQRAELLSGCVAHWIPRSLNIYTSNLRTDLGPNRLTVLLAPPCQTWARRLRYYEGRYP
jgi:hypothetical protein